MSRACSASRLLAQKHARCVGNIRSGGCVSKRMPAPLWHTRRHRVCRDKQRGKSSNLYSQLSSRAEEQSRVEVIAPCPPSLPPPCALCMFHCAQEDAALRNLFEHLLAKDPGERLTVPEAHDHDWVRSALEGTGGGAGGEGPASLRRGPSSLTTGTGSMSSCFSTHALATDDDGSSCCDGAGDGDGGSSRHRDRLRGDETISSGKRVAVTDEEVRAAVTRAPGIVVVVSDRFLDLGEASVLLKSPVRRDREISFRFECSRRA